MFCAWEECAGANFFRSQNTVPEVHLLHQPKEALELDVHEVKEMRLQCQRLERQRLERPRSHLRLRPRPQRLDTHPLGATYCLRADNIKKTSHPSSQK